MCSVVEIVNNDEYNIYYQSPQTLQHKELPPIIESETEQDFSLEEFGSYHFIKESSTESSPSKELKITKRNKPNVSDNDDVTITSDNKQSDGKEEGITEHQEVKKKLSDGKKKADQTKYRNTKIRIKEHTKTTISQI